MTTSPKDIDRFRPLLQVEPGTFATPEQAALLDEAGQLDPAREGRWRRWERLEDVWTMLEAKVEGKPSWVKTLDLGDLWLLGENASIIDMVTSVRDYLATEMTEGKLPRVGFRVTSIVADGFEPRIGLWYRCAVPGEDDADREAVGDAACAYIEPHRYKLTHYRGADDNDGDDIDSLPVHERKSHPADGGDSAANATPRGESGRPIRGMPRANFATASAPVPDAPRLAQPQYGQPPRPVRRDHQTPRCRVR